MDKKALIVGGSNGIGLAVSLKLINKGYKIIIVDRQPVDSTANNADMEFIESDLRFFDSDLFSKLSEDSSIDFMFLSAGIGRVSDYDYFHFSEIEKSFKINTVSLLEIISLFYDRIKSDNNFYCGIMTSIAGFISSPMFSVYAASKAALCRFIESVNIELEVAGTKNRILNIAPGSIKGTRFNGKDNDLDLVFPLADQIISNVLSQNTLFIPEYDSVFKDVIERYNSDPHEYGLHSYTYKKDSGRAKNEYKVKIGYLSGTFDLFHIGHLNLLKRAKAQCDYLIVGVHKSGAWKGKETFIPFEERKAIVESCKYVDKAVESCSEDSDAWDLWHYNMLFVGDDYKGTERFRKYEEMLSPKGVSIVYFPYTKGTSSTQLRKRLE